MDVKLCVALTAFELTFLASTINGWQTISNTKLEKHTFEVGERFSISCDFTSSVIPKDEVTLTVGKNKFSVKREDGDDSISTVPQLKNGIVWPIVVNGELSEEFSSAADRYEIDSTGCGYVIYNGVNHETSCVHITVTGLQPHDSGYWGCAITNSSGYLVDEWDPWQEVYVKAPIKGIGVHEIDGEVLISPTTTEYYRFHQLTCGMNMSTFEPEMKVILEKNGNKTYINIDHFMYPTQVTKDGDFPSYFSASKYLSLRRKFREPFEFEATRYFHGGRYVCEAGDKSASVPFLGDFSPKVKSCKADSDTIKCEVEGYPLPTLEWRWRSSDMDASVKVNDSSLQNMFTVLTEEKNFQLESSLIIDNKTFASNDEFTLTARNQYGNDRMTSLLSDVPVAGSLKIESVTKWMLLLWTMVFISFSH